MPKKVLAAIAAAGLCTIVATPASAQDTAATAGGDVTADEATPLPPIVVTAPSEPARRRPRRAGQQTSSPAPGVVIDDVSGVSEGDFGGAPSVGAFTLGQLDLIGGATITNEAMYTFNKQSLDRAVAILPGVSMQNTGGSRNEKDIFVRGFDRFRVPLYMDGVRIYLPYDNRLDFNRFLTPDLAEVQVQKGYVSVLNGPGGMGGAINLVSRKPTREVELEGRVGLVTNGDVSDMNQWSSYAYAGTRQKGWYAQVSGTIVDQDHFSLSDDFRQSRYADPGAAGHLPGFPYENGGSRDHSEFQDWRVNAKVGITPNATDEYSINYTTQSSRKEAPLHTDRQIVQGYFFGSRRRFWEWPEWDISTLSWLSKTQLGDASYVKTNAFYNTFDNTLSFYPDQTYGNPFLDSIYRDDSYGGFVEFGTKLIPMNTLKGSIHYRRDTHDEYDIDFEAGGARSPTETDQEETWSFAVENTFHATPNVDIVTGLSYDWNEVLKSDATTDPLPSADAWNWQTAAIWSYSATGKAHASVSSRTRFPTLFDRFSTRFGSRPANPDLAPERATNYEIGLSDTIFRNVTASGAVFYSDVEDSIQNAFTGPNGNNSIVGYNADAEYYGLEISADWTVMPGLRIGGNYTYMERSLDTRSAARIADPADAAAIAASQLEGTPRHEAFIYLAWQATDKLTLTPSLELASDRSSLITSCASTLIRTSGNAAATGECAKTSSPGLPNYARTGSYSLVNFSAEYALTEKATATIGVTNLFDENYSLAEGFPEAGRQFFANARVKF